MIIIDNEWSFIHAPKTSGTNFTLCFPDDRIIKYTGNQLWDEFWEKKSPEFVVFLDTVGAALLCGIS